LNFIFSAAIDDHDAFPTTDLKDESKAKTYDKSGLYFFVLFLFWCAGSIEYLTQ
jgi:hypothetical protein